MMLKSSINLAFLAAVSFAVLKTIATQPIASRYRCYNCVNKADSQEDVTSSAANLEKYSRLDYLPCSGVCMPRQNQLTIHRTRFKIKSSLLFCKACLRLKKDIYFVYKNIRYIKSPGFFKWKTYRSNVLAYYNISCGDGYQLTLHFLHFDLQDKIEVQGSKFCVDYVNISSSELGNIILCGNSRNASYISVPSSDVLVTFRSSGVTNYKGFHMSATCVRTNMEVGSATACSETKEQITVDSSHINRLLQLYRTFITTTHLLSGSSYKEMLMLAVMSESSCDPVVRTVGSEVLKHFPAKLVTQYKYITSMQEEYE